MYSKMTDAKLLMKVAKGVYPDAVEFVSNKIDKVGIVEATGKDTDDIDFKMDSMHPLWAKWGPKYKYLRFKCHYDVTDIDGRASYYAGYDAYEKSLTPRGIAEAIAECIDAEKQQTK